MQPPALPLLWSAGLAFALSATLLAWRARAWETHGRWMRLWLLLVVEFVSGLVWMWHGLAQEPRSVTAVVTCGVLAALLLSPLCFPRERLRFLQTAGLMASGVGLLLLLAN